MIASSLIMYLANMNMFTSISFVALLVFGFGIAAMAMIHQRDKLDNGIISYGKALAIGILVIVIGTFISGLWNFVLVNFIDTEYISTMKEQFVSTWGDFIKNEDQMEEALSKFDDIGSVKGLFASSLLNGVFGGLIIGLITAAFVKREPRMDYMR